MSDQKARVRNAADAEQVRRAEREDRLDAKMEIEDIKVVLSTENGRRFIWKLLDHCNVFRSIWESSSKIHYYAGMQDVGHFIMSEITAADQDSFITMMNEAKRRDERNG
jgi:hypothetical protein